MAVILSFRDLDVYKLACEQAKTILTITKSFPKEEKYSLTDQIRRSSRAVNPVPRTYVRGFRALPFGQVQNIHPPTHGQGVLWYGVNAMIAEAWARRRYPGAFVNKIDEALGEAMETQAWLDHARDCDYLDRNQHRELDDTWQHVGAMLSKMIERSGDFCKSARK